MDFFSSSSSLSSDTFLDRIPLLVRLFTAGSGVCLCIAGIVNLSLPACYTTAIVSLGLIFSGVVAILCEFSPYGLSVLMILCPLLGEYFFRGFLYIIVGLLPLGKEMAWIGRFSGCLMLLSGVANVGVHFMLPNSIYYYTSPTNYPSSSSYFQQETGDSSPHQVIGRGTGRRRIEEGDVEERRGVEEGDEGSNRGGRRRSAGGGGEGERGRPPMIRHLPQEFQSMDRRRAKEEEEGHAHYAVDECPPVFSTGYLDDRNTNCMH
ncbi:transmembrane protein [Cystoisospora suis]|uniref:Transmembrane protein n=1 Tax=Cystoisospora suis TaxID=483139 RepID=A0A2C6KGX8_9APIC|nr:transmembrane protein [Cystoisospora suis]